MTLNKVKVCLKHSPCYVHFVVPLFYVTIQWTARLLTCTLFPHCHFYYVRPQSHRGHKEECKKYPIIYPVGILIFFDHTAWRLTTKLTNRTKLLSPLISARWCDVLSQCADTETRKNNQVLHVRVILKILKLKFSGCKIYRDWYTNCPMSQSVNCWCSSVTYASMKSLVYTINFNIQC